MTFEQQKNTKALVWTAGIHLLLLLAFLLLKYTLPAQPAPAEFGMEVNLGTSDNGSGDDQPEDPNDPAAAAASVSSPAASDNNSSDREIQTSEEEDAPAVPAHPRTETRRNAAPAVTHTTARRQPAQQSNNTVAARTPAQSPRYVYPGATGTGGNRGQNNRPGSNEGIGDGPGDQGVPGGTVGASNYSGVPGSGGTAISSSIAGRSIVSRPDPKAEFREGGRVVIRVTVNRDGVITDSRVVSAANATIRALALKKLQGVRFNKSTSAPAEQFGNITFEFRTTRK